MANNPVDSANSCRGICVVCKQPIGPSAFRPVKQQNVGGQHHLYCCESSQPFQPELLKGLELIQAEDQTCELDAKQSQSTPQVSEARPTKRQKSEESFITDEADKICKRACRGKRIEKAEPKPRKGKGKGDMAPDQYLQFLDLCEMYEAQTAKQLREQCKRNRQKVSGTKKQLVERCAEGKLLGVLPMCTHCGQGHLKPNFKRQSYICRGYKDNGQLVRCESEVRFDELQRVNWQD